MEQRYSIAIVGCGPAGLSAALNAKIRNKSTLLFGDNGISSKVSRAGLVKNYLGLPSVSGDELRKAFSEHIKQMGITITDTHIDGIYSMGNYFVLCSHGKMYEAKTVILAVGSKVANPLPGKKISLVTVSAIVPPVTARYIRVRLWRLSPTVKARRTMCSILLRWLKR